MAKAKSVDDVNWDAAIDKLTSMTQRGDLVWEVDEGFKGRGDDVVVPPAFEAEVQGRTVRVYEYQYKNYTDVDEWDWSSGIAIEFVDGIGHLEYSWQGNYGSRRRLLDAIRFKAAHVDEFLQEFLHD